MSPKRQGDKVELLADNKKVIKHTRADRRQSFCAKSQRISKSFFKCFAVGVGDGDAFFAEDDAAAFYGFDFADVDYE